MKYAIPFDKGAYIYLVILVCDASSSCILAFRISECFDDSSMAPSPVLLHPFHLEPYGPSAIPD